MSDDPKRPKKDLRSSGLKRGYSRLTVTLPEELALAARAEVEETGAPSLSAYVAKAVAEKLERDRLSRALAEHFQEQPITEEERAWADRVLHGP